jgi:hypothetical protein
MNVSQVFNVCSIPTFCEQRVEHLSIATPSSHQPERLSIWTPLSVLACMVFDSLFSQKEE